MSTMRVIKVAVIIDDIMSDTNVVSSNISLMSIRLIAVIMMGSTIIQKLSIRDKFSNIEDLLLDGLCRLITTILLFYKM